MSVAPTYLPLQQSPYYTHRQVSATATGTESPFPGIQCSCRPGDDSGRCLPGQAWVCLQGKLVFTPLARIIR
jgi:hypothetical protein